ncbi:SMI1/KNR4 family protein [Paenibacillus barcinonensis]|uniref:SMI1/KNR4 family protein n=1 Tax=Paenibacillus barcinonensis TaxID=198119 RepID=A0A2V4VW80_PAEBA|nr:SMI1/KNR4 family protein [Paenibacillus barcinonensis]PYE49298.1 SUKH superfamily protein [Paenibacillus barcinonensis]QKS55516.1 SMI1/KNR4 family protein [Paenibacillus barcinonensis]
METDIIQIIQLLRKNASSENPFQSLIPGSESQLLECEWNKGADSEEISKLYEKNDWLFPEDYKIFLREHNGGILFQHAHYGGGTELLSLEKINIISGEYDNIPKHCYPIAWTDHIIGAICIDSVKLKNGEDSYLFFLDAMENMENAVWIPLDFTEWLHRLVLCQGQEFWNWNWKI